MSQNAMKQAVALVSGGKDSCYAAQLAADKFQLDIVCLAHISAHAVQPSLWAVEKDANAAAEADAGSIEADSYIYQSVASEAVPLLAIAFHRPLYIMSNVSEEKHHDTQLPLEPQVWRLYRLLSRIILDFPLVKYVVSGAIASNYQRLRIEKVCRLLGLVSVAPLWFQDQVALLESMTDPHTELEAILVKVCSIGLTQKHLGKSLRQSKPLLLKLHSQFGVHPCGEGGEYETFTLNSDLFPRFRLQLDESRVRPVAHDLGADVHYLFFPPGALYLVDKTTHAQLQHKWLHVPNAEIQVDSKEASWPLPASVAAAKSILTFRSHILGSEDTVSVTVLSPNDHVDHRYLRGDFSEPVSTELQHPTKATSLNSPRLKSLPHGIFSASCSVRGDSIAACVHHALYHLETSLLSIGTSLNACSFVCIALSDMEKFTEMNAVYSMFWRSCSDPPARVCFGVEPLQPSSLKSECNEIHISVLGFAGEKPPGRSLHVESLSSWAPACIGPYAQSHRLQDLMFVAGQIPLNPSSMLLTEDLSNGIQLCFQHASAVVSSQASAISVFHGKIFISSPAVLTSLAVTDDLRDCPILQVQALPKQAPFEVFICNNTEILSQSWHSTPTASFRTCVSSTGIGVIEVANTSFTSFDWHESINQAFLVEIFYTSRAAEILQLASQLPFPHTAYPTISITIRHCSYDVYIVYWTKSIVT